MSLRGETLDFQITEHQFFKLPWDLYIGKMLNVFLIKCIDALINLFTDKLILIFLKYQTNSINKLHRHKYLFVGPFKQHERKNRAKLKSHNSVYIEALAGQHICCSLHSPSRITPTITF